VGSFFSICCLQTGHFFCHILIPIFSSNWAYKATQYQPGICLSVSIRTKTLLFLLAQMLFPSRVNLWSSTDSSASSY
jgi:hypothetical protein